MKKIKCVIFDFGGVIGLPQQDKYIKEMLDLTGMRRQDMLPRYFDYRSDYDQGLMDTKPYWENITNGYLESISDELLKKLCYADFKSWTKINEATLDWIKKLHVEGTMIALLSNINYGVLEYCEKDFDWLELFVERFYSCDMRLLKPDLDIYTKVIEQLDVKASECLFLDDSSDNVQGAIASGLESLVFTDFESTIKEINSKYEIQ